MKRCERVPAKQGQAILASKEVKQKQKQPPQPEPTSTKKRSASLPRYVTNARKTRGASRLKQNSAQLTKALIDAHDEGQRRRTTSINRITANLSASECASPALVSRKRPASPSPLREPPSKKMASSDDLLRAISDVGKNVASINQRLQSFCTKDDFQHLTQELKGGIQKNADNIASLKEQRIEDQQLLSNKVERIVDKHVSRLVTLKGNAFPTRVAQQEEDFLSARRTILIRPITGSNLEAAARDFFKKVLLLPEQTVDQLEIEHAERTRQVRRSQIRDELLVRFKTAADRDVAQSYAFNLATAGREAGLRLHIPDHLKSLFKQFEKHAADLKVCLLYTSPSPRDRQKSRMPSSA